MRGRIAQPMSAACFPGKLDGLEKSDENLATREAPAVSGVPIVSRLRLKLRMNFSLRLCLEP